jgi:hypothetical protein
VLIKKGVWQALVRMWREGNPHTVLTGLQMNKATMENTKEPPKNLKMQLLYDSGEPPNQ